MRSESGSFRFVFMRELPRHVNIILKTPLKYGGGGGNRTRVPGKQTSRDYMLSPERVFCRAMASELESRSLVRMEFSRPTARGLRLQPCLLWRSSGVAGVHRRTSRHIRPRELIVR